MSLSEDVISRVLSEVESINRSSLSTSQRLALRRNLAGWESADQVMAHMVEVQTRQRWLSPADFNPEPRVSRTESEPWKAQWSIVSSLYVRGGGTIDYGSDRTNRAAFMIRKTLASGTEADAMWAFKAAYESAYELDDQAARIEAGNPLAGLSDVGQFPVGNPQLERGRDG